MGFFFIKGVYYFIYQVFATTWHCSSVEFLFSLCNEWWSLNWWSLKIHARTHTHMGFSCSMGTFQRRNDFYSVTVYYIPYTPKPTHHRKLSAFLHFQKTYFLMILLIYKLFSSWGPKNVSTRTRILDIAISVGTFSPHNVPGKHTHTHTHTNVWHKYFNVNWLQIMLDGLLWCFI